MGVQLTYHPIPPPGNAAFEVLSILLFIHYTCLPSRRQIFRAEQSTPGCLHGNWHWFFRQHSCSIKNDPFVFLKWSTMHKMQPLSRNFRGRGHPVNASGHQDWQLYKSSLLCCLAAESFLHHFKKTKNGYQGSLVQNGITVLPSQRKQQIMSEMKGASD